MSEMDNDNFHLWQLVWQVSQSKEKYRIAFEKERDEHRKTAEELKYVKNLITIAQSENLKQNSKSETESNSESNHSLLKRILRKISFRKN